ncbi:MAG: nucleotidyltransferase domain-containing protein [Syntrophaceae bacterium]|nr:nucleotidyltransferase domain-containing protein [Syntrophaceae bacterium]
MECEENRNRDLLVNILKEVLEQDREVLFAYLYGSSAFNPFQPESDIDVAVYLKPSDTEGYIRKERALLAILITKLHNDRIDLRILNTCPFLLQYNIIKDGVPIIIRDEAERVEFETRVMNRFFELKPFLNEYERMFALRIKAGV